MLAMREASPGHRPKRWRAGESRRRPIDEDELLAGCSYAPMQLHFPEAVVERIDRLVQERPPIACVVSGDLALRARRPPHKGRVPEVEHGVGENRRGWLDVERAA